MGVRSWLRQAWDLIGSDLPLFSLAAFLTITLSLFSAFILALPLAVGMCIMFQEKLHGRPPELSSLWEGVTAHFPASFVVYMVYMAGSLVFDFTSLLLHGQPPPWPLVGTGIALVGLWLVSTPLIFALPAIADRDLSGREALRLSWQHARPHLPQLFATVVACSLLLALGLFACGVGVVITLPLVAAVGVLAYRDLVGNSGAPEMTSLIERTTPTEEQSDEVEGDAQE